MKCDELETEYLYEDRVITPATHRLAYYRATQVDEAIAELKAENEALRSDYKTALLHKENATKCLNELEKELSELRNATRWHDCNEDGTPKEDYDGQDWVLVKFKEKDTGFELIPIVAEFRKHIQKWRPISNEEDGYLKYLDDICIAVGWREIEPSFTKKPDAE